MRDELHIASVLVHVRPEALARVADWLEERPGCEVRGREPAGKLVVVVESREQAALLALIDDVQTLAGVLGAALVYHQVLDPATADDPQEATP